MCNLIIINNMADALAEEKNMSYLKKIGINKIKII